MNLNRGEWKILPKYWYCTQCTEQLYGEPDDAETEAIAHRDQARHAVRVRFTRELLLKPEPTPALRLVPAPVPPPAHEDAAYVEKRYADVDLAVLAQSAAWPPGGAR